MTGPFESIIGRRIDRVMETTLTSLPTEFDVATADVRLCGTIVTADAETGRATAVERICITAADLPGLQAISSS
jgi:calcineurin-like phosphoesterase